MIGCFWITIGKGGHGAFGRSWLDETYPIYGSDEGAMWRNNMLQQYLSALYWAITTLTSVGYGDITPQNDWELLFCVVCMILGTFICESELILVVDRGTHVRA